MEPRELVEAALRVLKAWTSGEDLPATDVEILHQHARPNEVDLPIDDLACQIVNRECRRVIDESEQERKGAPISGDLKRQDRVRKIR